MIKLGVFAYMQNRAVPGEHIDTLDLLDFIRELNVDTIDLFLGRGLSSTEPAYLRKVKAKCVRYGLPIGYLASGVSLGGTDEEAVAKLATAKRDIDVAEFMGAQIVHVFARGGEVPPGSPEYERGWAQIVHRTQEMCEYAAGKGMIVGVQNHNNRSWLMRGDGVLRLLKDVNRGNFTFILDTGQWQGSKGSDPRGVVKDQRNPDVHEEHIALTAPYAAHVRAKMYKLDSGIEEFLPYGRIVDILRGVNYNGTIGVVLEHQGKQFDDKEAMRRAVRHIRDLLSK